MGVETGLACGLPHVQETGRPLHGVAGGLGLEFSASEPVLMYSKGGLIQS